MPGPQPRRFWSDCSRVELGTESLYNLLTWSNMQPRAIITGLCKILEKDSKQTVLSLNQCPTDISKIPPPQAPWEPAGFSVQLNKYFFSASYGYILLHSRGPLRQARRQNHLVSETEFSVESPALRYWEITPCVCWWLHGALRRWVLTQLRNMFLCRSCRTHQSRLLRTSFKESQFHGNAWFTLLTSFLAYV